MVKSFQQYQQCAPSNLPHPAVNWRHLGRSAPYAETLSDMEELVGKLIAKTTAEQVWLLEHDPLYTAGTSAKHQDLLTPLRFPVHDIGRGGQYTYHGPGQRICYVMLDLNQRGKDVRRFVTLLERWVIETLDVFGIFGRIRKGRVGVWVERPDKPLLNGRMREDKIAAIGIRMRRWVSFHGLSLNVCPNLEHYSGIVPCGISAKSAGHGVTSLHDLGIEVSMDEVDRALKAAFIKVFDSPLKSLDEA